MFSSSFDSFSSFSLSYPSASQDFNYFKSLLKDCNFTSDDNDKLKIQSVSSNNNSLDDRINELKSIIKENYFNCLQLRSLCASVVSLPPKQGIEYFPVGHEGPEALFNIDESITYSLLNNRSYLKDNSSAIVNTKKFPKDRKILFAASSDPRHVIETLSTLSRELWYIKKQNTPLIIKEFTFPKLKNKKRIPQYPINLEIIVNDLITENIARTVLLISLTIICGVFKIVSSAPKNQIKTETSSTSYYIKINYNENSFDNIDNNTKITLGDNFERYKRIYLYFYKFIDKSNSLFLPQCLWHIWSSINLVPPIHIFYKRLLQYLMDCSDWNDNLHLLSLFDCSDILKSKLHDIWLFWYNNADKITITNLLQNATPIITPDHISGQLDDYSDSQDESNLNSIIQTLDSSPELYEMAKTQILSTNSKLKNLKEDDLKLLIAKNLKQTVDNDNDSDPQSYNEFLKFQKKFWSKNVKFSKLYPTCILPASNEYQTKYSNVKASHKVNSSLHYNQNNYLLQSVDQQYVSEPFINPKSFDKTLSPFETIYLSHFKVWEIFITLLHPNINSIKISLFDYNLCDSNMITSLPCDYCLLSNVPDYVNILNTLPIYTSNVNELCFNGLLTMGTWLKATDYKNYEDACKYYLYSQSRLTDKLLLILGWKSYYIETLFFRFSKVPLNNLESSLISYDDFIYFLNDLFLLYAYPFERQYENLELYCGITLGSIFSLINIARVPYFWFYSLFDSLNSGVLKTFAEPPKNEAESPCRKKSNIINEYNVKAFSLESKLLDPRNRLNYQFKYYISDASLPASIPFTTTINYSSKYVNNSPLNKGDTRLYFVHPKSVKKFTQSFNSKSSNIQSIHSIDNIHIISSLLTSGEGDRILLKLPEEIFTDFYNNNYSIFVAHPSYKFILCTFSFSDFKPYKQKDNNSIYNINDLCIIDKQYINSDSNNNDTTNYTFNIQLGISLITMGNMVSDLNERKSFLEHGIDILNTVLDDNDYRLHFATCDLANIYGLLGNIKKKQSLLEQCKNNMNILFGANHIFLSFINLYLSTSYHMNENQFKKIFKRSWTIIKSNINSKYFNDIIKVVQNLYEFDRVIGLYNTSKTVFYNEILSLALSLKENGNKFIKDKSYQNAINEYSKVIKFLQVFIDYSCDNNDILQCYLACYSNLSLASLKEKQFLLVIDYANQILKHDNTYVKAYFRRGEAYYCLKKYKEAKYNYEETLKLDPNTREAKKRLLLLEKRLKK